jgi:regulator of protease activity HflC (stomatin/prohibitin superfamily)
MSDSVFHANSGGLVFLSLAFLPVCVVILVMAASSIKILREYERAVVFRLGRFQAVRGPGLLFIFPFVQQIVRVDLRTVVLQVPSQDVISRDNVSLKVDAILYFRVVDAQKAIIQVEDFLAATNMLAQTTLRSVLGEHELDEMLAKRNELNAAIQSTLDVQTESWGIKVISVEIREVTLTENMIRSIAKQAEAERDRRAKVIHAEAEFQAAQTLLDAARILAEDPAAMQLRYLQTLTEVGGEQNSTIVFPMPIDLIKPFLQIMQKHANDPLSASNGTPVSKGAISLE